MLGVRLLSDDDLDQDRRPGPVLGRIPVQALRSPLGIAPMARRHVLTDRRRLALRGRAHVRGNAPGVMEQLDRARSFARPQLLLQQRVWHRVVVLDPKTVDKMMAFSIPPG